MMMLLVLTSVLGYELKTAVGTSVFIMSATALTGSVSHFAIGGLPDTEALIICVISTLVFAQVAALLPIKPLPSYSIASPVPFWSFSASLSLPSIILAK